MSNFNITTFPVTHYWRRIQLSIDIFSLLQAVGSGVRTPVVQDFPSPPRQALDPAQTPVQEVPDVLLWSSAVGVWRWPPIPF